MPEYPIWITVDPINWVTLDTVLRVRAPDKAATAGTVKGLGKAELTQQLHFWATCLRTEVADLLSGDCAAIDEAAAWTRRQLEMHPQRIVVSLPDDASPEAEAAARAETAATVPPEVEVVVRRYQRPPRRGWFRT